MERRNKESRQSSLPSSLIPHLYSRPQQDDLLATTPFPALPLPASTGPEEEAEFSDRLDLPSMRSSFVLPPVSSSFAPPLLPVDAHRTPPFLNYEAGRLPVEHNPAISSADVPASGIVRSMGSLSLPSHVPGQRYASPIYSDPHYHTTHLERMSYGLNQNYPAPVAQGASPPRGSWREGEAGPSSLVHAYESARRSGRRGSSQPAQLTRHTEALQHRGDVSDGDGEGYSSRGREGYPGGALHSTQRGSLYSAWPSETYHTSASHVPHDMASAQIAAGYSQFPLTTVGASHSAWAGTSAGSGFGDYPGYSPNSASDVSSDGRPDDDGDGDGDDTYTTAQKGKKRLRSSDADADSTRKSRNPRKTAVACNFCRGRKLRCNGAKPACSNCMVRKFQCEYVPVQRRRGPGKAPKGTKSKKNSTGRSEPSTSLPPGDGGSGVMPEGPEHTPISLEIFSFNQPSERVPRGPGRRQRHGSRSPSVDSEPEQKR